MAVSPSPCRQAAGGSESHWFGSQSNCGRRTREQGCLTKPGGEPGAGSGLRTGCQGRPRRRLPLSQPPEGTVCSQAEVASWQHGEALGRWCRRKNRAPRRRRRPRFLPRPRAGEGSALSSCRVRRLPQEGRRASLPTRGLPSRGVQSACEGRPGHCSSASSGHSLSQSPGGGRLPAPRTPAPVPCRRSRSLSPPPLSHRVIASPAWSFPSEMLLEVSEDGPYEKLTPSHALAPRPASAPLSPTSGPWHVPFPPPATLSPGYLRGILSPSLLTGPILGATSLPLWPRGPAPSTPVPSVM